MAAACCTSALRRAGSCCHPMSAVSRQGASLLQLRLETGRWSLPCMAPASFQPRLRLPHCSAPSTPSRARFNFPLSIATRCTRVSPPVVHDLLRLRLKGVPTAATRRDTPLRTLLFVSTEQHAVLRLPFDSCLCSRSESHQTVAIFRKLSFCVAAPQSTQHCNNKKLPATRSLVLI